MLLLWVEWRGGKGKSLNPFIPLLHWKVREKKSHKDFFLLPLLLTSQVKREGTSSSKGLSVRDQRLYMQRKT